MGVKIVACSTADLSMKLKERLEIVPLGLNFGSEEFIDGVNISHDEFYNRLENSKVLPTTSQPSPQAFKEKYEEILRDGDEVVAVIVSSKLSGTYQSAILGAQGLEGVYVVDSLSASIGEGALCELALRLVDEGKSAIEIADLLTNAREKLTVLAMLDTLEYLQRGGRISKTSAFVGGLLSIKPVVTARDGEIVALGKARGLKNANNFLTKEIERLGGIDFDLPLLIGYSGNDDSMVKKYIEQTKDIWEGNVENPDFVRMGSVIGTHAGPGAVGVAFFMKG